MLKILGNKREVASDGLPVGSLCARGGEVFLIAYGNFLECLKVRRWCLMKCEGCKQEMWSTFPHCYCDVPAGRPFLVATE